MRKILEACPTCGGQMVVSELSCTVCDTLVRSKYDPCPFCRLSPEDLSFMLLFVKHRGNVKDMERELGISYWTIRGRLNEIIGAMGLDDGRADARPPAADDREPLMAGRQTPDERRAVLDRVQRGELSAADAAQLLAERRPPAPYPSRSEGEGAGETG